MTKREWMELKPFERAWRLNLVMSHMNNEEAYYCSGWLYIWPDEEKYEDCIYDFEAEEDYQDLERSFIKNYSDKEWHNDGLYHQLKTQRVVVETAHFWDQELGLEPIEIIQ